MITSAHNEQLKEVRKLHRRQGRKRAGRFVAEGEDLLAAADSAGWAAVERFVAAGSGLDGLEVEPEVLAGASTLGSGTRAIGVYEMRWTQAAGPLCVYLHGVATRGTWGRFCAAPWRSERPRSCSGPTCADPFGPKAVRASMGAIFSSPVARGEVGDLPGERAALVAHEGEPLRGPADGEVSCSWAPNGRGFRPTSSAACERVAHLPIASESLNAAMAATVALYELTRIAD